MRLCAVVVVLVSISIEYCAGGLEVAILDTAAVHISTAWKTGIFEPGATGWRVGSIPSPIDIGGMSVKGECYVVCQRAFATQFGLTYPVTRGLTLKIIKAMPTEDANYSPGALAVVIGRVLLDAFVVLEKDFPEVEQYVTIVADGDISPPEERYKVVTIKTDPDGSQLKKLQPGACVLLAFYNERLPR